jgi:MFS transporter, DHA1 family, multidrug resistance protein
LVVFAAFIDLFAGFPIIAPYARELGASAWVGGVVVATYSVANLVGNLGAGVVLDRWGRKSTIVGGLLISSVAVGLHAVAQDATQLIVLRAVHGLATAVLSPGAFALIGDAAPPDKRARAMGSAGVFIAAAALVAFPMAGIVRSAFGIPAVFLVVAAILALAAFVVALIAREPAVDGGQQSVRLGQLAGVLVRPSLLVSYVAILCFTIGIGALIEHLPIMLEARGEGPRASSSAFTVYAVVAMLGMAGPAARQADRHGRNRPLAGGLGLIGLALLALGLWPNMITVYAEMIVFGLGFSLLFPASTALVADASAPSERGTAFGVFYAVYSLGTIVGALTAGALSGIAGDTTTIPFVVTGALAMLAAPFVLRPRATPQPVTLPPIDPLAQPARARARR